MIAIQPQPQTKPMALVAYDLWKEYGDRSVVQGVSFSLNPGEILGVLGPNGAGKTTTVGMLSGSVIPTKGFVQIGPYSVQNQGRQARNYTGIVTQEDNLDPDFTVFENLLYFAHHYRITGKAGRQRASELLAQVDLQDYAKNEVDQLSGGMKRRLVLARALIHQPSVVFLDEPTTGLDPHARQEFWKLVINLKQQGVGVLLTTHYMDEAQRLCDRLLLIQQGKIVNQGTPLELIERTVGQEVVEVEGLSSQQLNFLTTTYQIWSRPFGGNDLLEFPTEQAQEFWQQLTQFQPISLTRRQANLEDVFLRLTGSALD